MYTQKQFGLELKQKVKQKQPVAQIGEWSHSMYLEHIENTDLDLDKLLLALATMELGPQFEYTYDELEKIADDLVAGKDVKL